MRRGGFDTDHDRVFLLSTTHGAETHALAACIATIEAYRDRDVCATLHAIGTILRDESARIAHTLGIAGHFFCTGRPANLVFNTLDEKGNRSQAYRTLFLQEMIRRGVLCPSFVVSEAFAPRDVDHVLWALAESLAVYRRALETGSDRYLLGRSVKPAFRRSA
jgi:glutamate-1-semialdehyde 2,1-aminomutase